MTKRSWKKISSKIAYSNPWIKIHEDQVIRPDGNQGIYGYLEKPPGNFIIALNQENEIYLIKEYRYPIKQTILQLPAGIIDNGDILAQAQKELFEEAGIIAKKWENLGKFFVAAGHETTYINTFLATDLDISTMNTFHQEHDESILEILKIKIPELKTMILDGKIECGISLAALNLFFLKYPDLL
jgi:8-oxo-dGTP pyrophosphatase MutT (NUDIX family)